MGAIHSLSDEDWNKTFSVNSTGVFYMSRAVSKHMMQRKSGAIVTVGSNAANTPRVEMAAYAASKAATTMFMKCLGLELAAYNIRCNLVSPVLLKLKCKGYYGLMRMEQKYNCWFSKYI